MARKTSLPRARIALALAVGLTASCRPAQEAPIRIGLLCPLTGEIAQDARLNLAGAELAVAEVNGAGGLEVGGRRHRVVLLVEDTENVAEVAVRVAQRLINQENVAALVGPFTSGPAIPVAAVAERAGVTMISPSASNPMVTEGKRFVFRSCFSDDFQGRVIARFAREDLGARRAAVLYDVTSAYSKGLAEIFRTELAAAGGEVVVFESFLRGDRDFLPQLERVRDLDAEVLFLPNYSGSVRLQAQQARKLGITATLLGSDGWSTSTLAAVPEMEGAFKSGHWHPDVDNEKAQAFRLAFREAYGPTLDLNRAALAYEAMGLLFRAIEMQDSFDSGRIRDGLANLRGFQGVTGTISFRGSGDPVKGAVILQIRRGESVLYKYMQPL